MSKKISFVTCSTKPDFASDDLPLVDLLRSKGIEVQPLAWDGGSTEWSSFDLVVVRSCWNYHLHPEKFILWLNQMESEQVKLLNAAKTIRWNLHKSYLQELAQKGIPLPETSWVKKGVEVNLSRLMQEKTWEKVVVKPAISATAFNTFLISKNDADEQQPKILDRFKQADMLVQKFMSEVQEEGEWSLIFFNKKFSHAVIKQPKSLDFRVQNDFGGTFIHISPPALVLDQAEKIMSIIDEPLLYARVDGVVSNNQFKLMELELIEPMLFLVEEKAATKFADAICGHLQSTQ